MHFERGLLLVAIAALALLPAASANTHGASEGDGSSCTGVIPAVRCLTSETDGRPDRLFGKVFPFEEGPHCLPFEGYDRCA